MSAVAKALKLIKDEEVEYVEIVRGVPILVFLFYIAFVAAPAMVAAFNWLAAPLIGSGWIEPATVRGFDFVWRAIFALTAWLALIGMWMGAGLVDRWMDPPPVSGPQLMQP